MMMADNRHYNFNSIQIGQEELITPPHPHPSGIQGLVKSSRTTPQFPAKEKQSI